MKKRNYKIIGTTIVIGMLMFGSIPVSADSNKEEPVVEVTEKENGKSKEECEKRRQKTKEAMEKWDKLSEAQKAEVYQLVESKQQAKDKVLDKLVSLGVLNKEDVEQMKLKEKAFFEKMKKEGSFPLRGRHYKEKPNCNCKQ